VKRLGVGRIGVGAWRGLLDGGCPGFSRAEVDCLNFFFCSEKILCDHAALLSRAEDLGLLNHGVRVLDKTVSVATRACGDSFRHDGIAPFANLIKLRFRGNFGRFRCSFAERHILFSSELTELDSNFWRLPAKFRSAFGVRRSGGARLGNAGAGSGHR
jgi:hypothetical protein